MPIMPYAMEKGPYLSIVEDFLNDDRARALRALQDLRSGVPIVDLGPLDPPIQGSPYSPADLKRHVNRDWWGFEPVHARGTSTIVSWGGQPQFDAVHEPTTGFWQHWYGQPEKVFRETLVRALEVSLGLPHQSAAARARSVRHWHISLFWNCPHPWYEGWVGWKRHDDTPRGGQVTVVINTPAHRPPPEEGEEHHNGELFNSPLRPPPIDPKKHQPYEIDPEIDRGDNGLWLVSQVYHQEYTPPVPTNVGAPNTWRPPTLGKPIRSLGEVLTVAIAEVDGGVLPAGRPFQPGP